MISSGNTITGTGSYVGGNIGYSTAESMELTSSQNIKISGTNYVGGNIGYSTVASNGLISSQNTEISGTNYVGGNIGYSTAISSKLTSLQNTEISGTDYVGGCIGKSTEIIRNAKAESTNIYGTNFIGGILGKQEYCESSTNTKLFSINGAYVKKASINGNSNVGGVAGESLGTVYAAAVDESTIIAQEINAGGILGYYKPYQGSNSSKYNENSRYFLSHSFCTNSVINARENVGGLIGQFIFGYVQYCYAGNNKITAVGQDADIGKNAGGLIGLLNNDEMNETQYIAEITHSLSVNTINSGNGITGESGIGGLIGRITKGLTKDYITNNLIVTDIYTSTNSTSDTGIVIGMVEENVHDNLFDSEDKIYIYEGCKINGNKIDTTDSNNYKYLELVDLSMEATYDTDNLELVDTGRYNIIDNSTDFPSLGEPSQTIDNLKGMWRNLLEIDAVTIPIEATTTSAESFSLRNAILSENNTLPEIYSYSIDVNKINIEFSDINPNAYFKIKTDKGVVVEKTPIQERVYTFEYDFITRLEITVSNITNWYTEEISPENVKNKLDIQKDEYIYLKDNKIQSSKRTFEGEFVNLYDGKALTVDGQIYDLISVTIIEKLGNNKLKLLDYQIPISETEYEGTKIQTFYHCSKVIDGDKFDYKNQQIFIKNGAMYLVDGEIEALGDSIIIDSYNNNQYETILGTDGIMYDLMTEIKYPDGFKNQNIIDMTNNIENNSNIVLVYYENGRVCAFNYITGQEVYNNGIEEEKVSLMNYLINDLRTQSLLYNIEEKSLEEAQTLTEKLEHTSIEQALVEIDIQDGEETVDDSTKTELNKQPKYVTSYDTTTQKYVVYSTIELLNAGKTLISENDKIDNNEELTTFYSDLSISKFNLKQIGILLFVSAITLVCVILVAMYRKNLRKIGK